MNRIDGELLSDMDAASYCVIIASAGHDTTTDALSGGLHAHCHRRHHSARNRHRRRRIGVSGIRVGKRDEEVFDDPYRFDIARDPNRHLAFGHGAHFCLGASLARMEISSLLAALLPRLESIGVAGEPELAATTFVGCLKHLAIRYSMK